MKMSPSNGAFTMELNRGVAQIEHDLLGHPKRIHLYDGNTVTYCYAPDGRKLRVTHRNVSGRYPTTQTTKYHGARIYKNGVLDVVMTPEGFYEYDAASECYRGYYYVKDYQGNIRQVVTAGEPDYGPAVRVNTHYYPYGGIIANLSTDATGNGSNRKFGGKELDRTFGLDLYDFEARPYDPAGLWFPNVDKKASDTPHISPYAYCAGDSVNKIDPDGQEWYLSQDSTILYTNCKSQAELEDNKINGTFLGDMVVLIEGSM